MMSGGVMPTGICFVIVCAMAVTCEMARSSDAFGWKKTFVTETPFIVWLSMCSMSLTVVGTDRSNTAVIRPVNSVGVIPVYCQTMATTGILIFGKISVGVCKIMIGLRMRIN